MKNLPWINGYYRFHDKIELLEGFNYVGNIFIHNRKIVAFLDIRNAPIDVGMQIDRVYVTLMDGTRYEVSPENKSDPYGYSTHEAEKACVSLLKELGICS
jgi:hypothetical protein